MNSILRKAGELGLNASAGHAMKFSGCTWYETKIREEKGQSGGIIQKGEPHERNPCASSFGESTWGNLTTRRLCQQSSVEFGEKICKLKAEDKTTFYSLVEKRRQKHRRSYVYCGFGSFNAHAE